MSTQLILDYKNRSDQANMSHQNNQKLQHA